jgi:hypothetical protein
MADYRITCIVKSQSAHPWYHSHIIRIGLGSDQGWNRIMSVSEVYIEMDAGNRFYTVSPSTSAVAMVHKYQCHQCMTRSLQSGKDAVQDNNLDDLPECRGG